MNSSRTRYAWAPGCALLVAALATASGCASSGVTESEQVYQAPGGYAVVDKQTFVGTVTAVDAAKRKVTFLTPDGKSSTFKAASGIDLAGLRVGQTIGLQATEAMLLVVSKGGALPDGEAAVELAGGDSAGAAVLVGDAVRMSATIVALDPSSRKATLQFQDGTTRNFKVHKGIDLTGVAVGDVVTAAYAESLVIATDKP